ncbi:MAG: hypothetical protein L6R45_03705 [Anaerolineae bacterium]|nr:hypothetical protein [Anaerolineae bacterium]
MPQSVTLISYLWRGAALGAVTGLTVSMGYTVLLIAFFLVSMFYGALNIAPKHPEDAAMMLLVGPASAGFMFICAGFIGILPGILLGTIIGLLISLPVGLFGPRLSGAGAAIIGGVVSVVVVALIHVLLINADPDPTLREYLLPTIIPGFLCIGAGSWVGWKLWIGSK